MNNNEMKGSFTKASNFAKLFRVTKGQFHLQVIGPDETRHLASADKPSTDVARGLAIVEGVGGQLFSR
jgi:hypothetical protein